MIKFRKLAAVAAVTLGVLAIAPVSQAADAYPSQPLKLLVPFPPGGCTDTMARFVANALTEEFKWNVVVDNRPGAGGTVGLGVLSRSAPNGYNIALGQTSNLSINPYLYSNISYDVAKDFSPVVSVAAQPMVLIVGADKPYKSVKELVEIGRAKDRKRLG